MSLVKVAGEVTLDPVTGQIVATFKNTPQLPFEDLELHFFGSARAPLTTPPLCGSYTTRRRSKPWSGNPPAEPSSTFQITSGPNGAPCADPLPFTPGFEAGSTNLQAGAFTPFTMTMSRPDADQTLSGVELHMPPGLLGTLSNVKLCGEPQADAGDVWPGKPDRANDGQRRPRGQPLHASTGGKVFITGPYKGAPFGLSIVNPAKAGPFDLGTVVVRAKIEVDPHTAALTITTSDPLPTILDGIPLQIQHVNVSVEPRQVHVQPDQLQPKQRSPATLTSTEGATATRRRPFQVTNCATLAFKPVFRGLAPRGRPPGRTARVYTSTSDTPRPGSGPTISRPGWSPRWSAGTPGWTRPQSTTCTGARPIRPARTTATSAGWPSCWPGCR